MQKPTITFFLTLLAVLKLQAQQTGRMETDRPDQTESPFLTKHKYLQTEIGINVEKNNSLKTFVHPTILWKYGVSKRFELRLITESITLEIPALINPQMGNENTSGILPVQIGGKIALAEEKGIAPKTSLIFHLAVPKIASKKFKAAKWAPNFRFVMQNTLSETVGVGYNIGAEWDGETNTPGWIYTFAPGFNIGKRWYGYLEAFGAVKKNEKPEHLIDGGFAFFVSDNVKIDISSGWGLTKNSLDTYCAIGFSWRMKALSKKSP